MPIYEVKTASERAQLFWQIQSAWNNAALGPNFTVLEALQGLNAILENAKDADPIVAKAFDLKNKIIAYGTKAEMLGTLDVSNQPVAPTQNK